MLRGVGRVDPPRLWLLETEAEMVRLSREGWRRCCATRWRTRDIGVKGSDSCSASGIAAAGGRAREGGWGHLCGAGGHHLEDLRAGAWPLCAQVRSHFRTGRVCGVARSGCGRRSSPGKVPSCLLSQLLILGRVGAKSLILRLEVWVGTRREGGPKVVVRPRRLPKASAYPAPRFEKAFLESEAVSEPHLGANINACEELR